MSSIAAASTSRCRTIARCRSAARIFPLAPRRTQNASGASVLTRAAPSVYTNVTWTRSKTTSKTKIKSLPQGSIAALPDDASDLAKVQVGKADKLEKTYSRTLQQHRDNMRKYPDCLVLTRVGNFYEIYFEQVAEYAPLVNLTQAEKGDVPMAGFQYHHLGRYLKMFVQDLGKQVAISEQVPLPEGSPGRGAMFDRRVTRIVSAGTLIDEDFLDPSMPNYLLAVHCDPSLLPVDDGEQSPIDSRSIDVGLSWVDLSSGEFYTQAGTLNTLSSLVAGIRPSEIILNGESGSHGSARLQNLLGEGGYAVHYDGTNDQLRPSAAQPQWNSMLERPLTPVEEGSFVGSEIAAMNMLLSFVRTRLIEADIKLQPPIRKTDEEYMSIDRQSIRALEISRTLRESKLEGSLLHAVRRTVTRSGDRLLSDRLTTPSLSLSVINERLDLVQQMLENDALREDLVALLRKAADIRRLLQRCSACRGDADDLLNLAATIEVMGSVADRLNVHLLAISQPAEVHAAQACLQELWSRFDLDEPRAVAKAIKGAIDEESLRLQHEAEDEQAAVDTEGSVAAKSTPEIVKGTETADIWIMRRGATPTLKAAHGDVDKLTEKKMHLLARLRKQLKAESLTFKWTAQLGHHCHVKGKNHAAKIAELSGARLATSTKSTQTFYLAEWTDLGVITDDAKLRIRKEEERVFDRLRARILENRMRLRRNASVLDELDVASSFAGIAKERNLVRPHIHAGTAHHIVDGRHPTVDLGLTTAGRQFTANDCAVGSSNASIYLITGPNMGGKSTYLRQNALVTILAQTGCYVPANYASIGLVDKMFSRIGSADNLYQDQSTFMVEMLETAHILKEATSRSFVVMDEVGRGTTPEDGVAVGYAVLKHLHEVNKCRTLFATHFHDLADMTVNFGSLERWCTDVDEAGESAKGSGASQWSYLHKLRKGVNRDSHALKVARLAGMPDEAVRDAEEVLASLRRQREARSGTMAGSPERE